jgi:hypothetical protein|tara:strand:+ start:1259 stop:1504 length:246 start_codon:yes stop_codon:yes gene_type:complete
MVSNREFLDLRERIERLEAIIRPDKPIPVVGPPAAVGLLPGATAHDAGPYFFVGMADGSKRRVKGKAVAETVAAEQRLGTQ